MACSPKSWTSPSARPPLSLCPCRCQATPVPGGVAFCRSTAAKVALPVRCPENEACELGPSAKLRPTKSVGVDTDADRSRLALAIRLTGAASRTVALPKSDCDRPASRIRPCAGPPGGDTREPGEGDG